MTCGCCRDEYDVVWPVYAEGQRPKTTPQPAVTWEPTKEPRDPSRMEERIVDFLKRFGPATMLQLQEALLKSHKSVWRVVDRLRRAGRVEARGLVKAPHGPEATLYGLPRRRMT